MESRRERRPGESDPQRESAPLSNVPSSEPAIHLPRLSSLEELSIKLHGLKPGHRVRVETLQSIDYQCTDDRTKGSNSHGMPCEEALHEPIMTFSMYFDGEYAMSQATGSRRAGSSGPPSSDEQPLFDPPPTPRPPRSPLHAAPPNPSAELTSLGSEFLANFISPGCEATRAAFQSLKVSTTGLRNIAELEQFHAERLSRPYVFPPPMSWKYWREHDSAEVASLERLAPFEPITLLLQETNDPHRTMELHSVFACFQFYLRATPDGAPISVNTARLQTEGSRLDLVSLRAETEEIMRPDYSNFLKDYDPKVAPRRQPPYALSQDKTLMLLYMGFEKVARGLARSLPTNDTGGRLLREELCNFSPAMVFQAGKSYRVMQHQYQLATRPETTTHYIDLRDVHLVGDTAEKRRRELQDILRGHLPIDFNSPSTSLGPSETLKKVRPHVYTEAEERFILEAAQEVLSIFIENDLETNGPRTGTRALKHLFEVGVLLMLSGERPEVVVAGLFHDLYELYEANKSSDELLKLRGSVRDKFGEDVDDLIQGVTEPVKGARDSNEFFARKASIVKKLKTLPSPLRAEVARILCASKISTIQDGLFHVYNKGTTKGWSSGSWAQNVALHSFLLQSYEDNNVTSALTVYYRAQLTRFCAWARNAGSESDLAEIRDNVASYFLRLGQCV